MKRLFVGTKKKNNPTPSPQKTREWKCKRHHISSQWGLVWKLWKGNPCPTHSLWVGLSTSWHHPLLPEPARGRTGHWSLVFALEWMLSRLLFTVLKKVCLRSFLLFSVSRLCFRSWLYHSGCFLERLTLEAERDLASGIPLKSYLLTLSGPIIGNLSSQHLDLEILTLETLSNPLALYSLALNLEPLLFVFVPPSWF